MSRRRAQLKDAVLAVCRRSVLRVCMRCTPSKMNTDAWAMTAWERATDSDEIFWLSCLHAPTKVFAAKLEALEILALVAHADIELWKEITREIWNTCEWMDLIASRSAFHIGIDVDVEDDQSTIREACESVVAWMRAPRRSRYSLARGLIDGMNRKTGLPRIEVPIRINLDGYYHDNLDIPALLWAVHDILATQPSLQEATTTARVSHYRAGSLDLTMDGDAIASLAAIRSLGIQVTDLTLTHVGLNDLDRRQCLNHVPELLDSIPKEVAKARRYPLRQSRVPYDNRPVLPPGVERIFLSSSLPEGIVPGICSSIHASKSLRSLEIEMEDDESAGLHQDQLSTFFRWMGFALFCRAPLAELTFSESHRLQLESVRQILDVVTATNSLSILFPDQIVPEDPVVAVATAVLLNHPSDVTKPTEWMAKSLQALDVIGQSRDGYLPILLPGWGLAWANEQDALVKPKTSAHRATVVQSPVRLVIQSVVTSATPAILELINFIGRNVKQIMIHEYSCGTPALDGFCAAIFKACPELEELELRNLRLDSLQCISEAFNGNQCPCLKRLILFSVEVGSLREVDAILRSLADPTNEMAVQLRVLSLQMDTSDDPRPETFTLMEDMLKRNSHLREVVLTIGFSHPLVRLPTRLRVYDHYEILGDPVPPPRPTVIALLSVILHRGRTKIRWRKALQQFDSLILSRILSFAGTRRIRTVEISV